MIIERNPLRVRDCKIKLGTVKNVSGSCYLEMGETKVYATVRGPYPSNKNQNPGKGIIFCTYEMANFGRLKKTHFNRRSIELSQKIRQVFERTINLFEYPKQEIHLHSLIISSGGSTRCAAISALSVALVHAGISVTSLIPSISFGKYKGEMLLDLDTLEDNEGEADFALAYDPFNNYYLLQQMDGFLTLEEVKKGLAMAKKGLFYIYYLQKIAIFEHFKEEIGMDKYDELVSKTVKEGETLFNLSILETKEITENIKEL